MPTQDNTNTTRIQFLKNRIGAKNPHAKGPAPDASYKVDLRLGHIVIVKKTIDGKSESHGCGVGGSC
jgi:hypothetical protein